MSIADYSNYVQRRDAPFQRARVTKNTLTTVAGRPYSMWASAGLPAAGAAPTTAVVPGRTTTGALGQINSSGTQRILSTIFSWATTTTTGGGLVTIIDRLSHQGGLSGTVTTAQSTNLPTAALTRKTSGVGVILGLEVYTQIGATGTTVTASYTDQGGTTGQTTPANTFGNTGFREAGRIILLSLAAGDTGVRAVASVTVLATTGTAGNFGVTLFYPYLSVPMIHTSPSDDFEALLDLGSWFAVVDTDACLSFMVHSPGTATGVIQGTVRMSED